MKPVHQTEFGSRDCPVETQGNCFQACVASILEIPLEEAFDCRGRSDESWFDEFNTWLAQYGLACIAFDHTVEKPLACSEIKGYAIMECESTTLHQGEDHVVVIKDQEVVHDPNPTASKVGKCQGFYIFVPLDLAILAIKYRKDRILSAAEETEIPIKATVEKETWLYTSLCPFLLWSREDSGWYATADFERRGRTACERSICGRLECHNFGKKPAESGYIIGKTALTSTEIKVKEEIKKQERREKESR